MIIGIDPGLSGAISIIDKKNDIYYCYNYLRITKGSRSHVKGDVESSKIRKFLGKYADCSCCIEEPLCFSGKSGVDALAKQYCVYGQIIACLDYWGISFKVVKPKEWKRYFDLIGNKSKGIKITKQDSINKATEYDERFRFTSLQHADICEAFLIGLYGELRK